MKRKNLQVTLVKTMTGVIPEYEGYFGEDSPLADEPAVLWDILLGSGTVLQTDTEVLGVAEATDVCPVCCAPIRIKLNASLSAVYGDPMGIDKILSAEISCSADPSHEIPQETKETLTERIFKADYSTSSEP